MNVSQMRIYPIEGCPSPPPLREAWINEFGMYMGQIFDRGIVIAKDGKVIRPYDFPQLRHLELHLRTSDAGDLITTVEARVEGRHLFNVRPRGTGKVVKIDVAGTLIEMHESDYIANRELRKFLGPTVELFERRNLTPPTDTRTISILNTKTLDDFSREIGQEIAPELFSPNLIIQTHKIRIERNWNVLEFGRPPKDKPQCDEFSPVDPANDEKHFKIVKLTVAHPHIRGDEVMGVLKNDEPLKTLRQTDWVEYEIDGKKFSGPSFGMIALPMNEGYLGTYPPVTPLTYAHERFRYVPALKLA